MTQNYGILYGLGVGPGDPELITLKAARVLNSVDVVFAAASTKNSYSQAVTIARPHIRDLTAVRMLAFPMTRDKKELKKAWREHAQAIITELEQGRNVAFLTLGDSMTYSTYGYILQNIQALAPHLPVISVPGVTSYQAAAAATNTPLVEGEETLLVVSGAKGGDHLRNLRRTPDTVAFLKAYRNVADIASALAEADMLKNSIAVSNCGLPEQEIFTDIEKLAKREPKYWTLVLAKSKKTDETV
jgi:precorrin-2/cobalt-factor-2 C20-methyltransferase